MASSVTPPNADRAARPPVGVDAVWRTHPPDLDRVAAKLQRACGRTLRRRAGHHDAAVDELDAVRTALSRSLRGGAAAADEVILAWQLLDDRPPPPTGKTPAARALDAADIRLLRRSLPGYAARVRNHPLGTRTPP